MDAILQRLDRIILLLEALQPSCTGQSVSSTPKTVERISEPEEEKSKTSTSDEVFEKLGPEIVEFLMGTQQLPRLSFTAEILAEELGMNPTSTARVARRLANENVIHIDKEGILSISDATKADDWLDDHPYPKQVLQPLDNYHTLLAVRLVRILLAENVMMTGKVPSALGEELKLGKSAIDRLVKHLTVALPFVIKDPGAGSSVRVHPLHFRQAREWLVTAEQTPEEQDLGDIGVSDRMFNDKAPAMVKSLLESPMDTAELMHRTETKYGSYRGVLRRLAEEGIQVSVAVAPRGQSPMVHLKNPDIARKWLESRNP